MRYDWKRDRYGTANRVAGWLLPPFAAMWWLLFAVLWAGWAPIVVPLMATTGAALQRVRLRQVYGIKDSSEEERPQPTPEPRVPRDTSRPYPRPKGSRSKLNRVCPVCGTGAETGDLDGKVLGWPAHASCAEWLGDWKPAEPGVPFGAIDPRPQQREVRHGSTNTIHYTGNGPGSLGGGAGGSGSITISVNTSPGAQVNVGNGNRMDGSFPIASAADLDRAQEMLRNGMISANEFRERLNQQIAAAWGVPPAMLEQHTHKAGDPIPVEQCPKCGARFCGPPDYLRSAYELHQKSRCAASRSLPS